MPRSVVVRLHLFGRFYVFFIIRKHVLLDDDMIIIINFDNTYDFIVLNEYLLSAIVIIFYDYLVIFYAENPLICRLLINKTSKPIDMQ